MVKKHTEVRSMVLAGLFAALTAAGAFTRIPLGIAAFTLQTLFTALSGLLLGPKWGMLSQGVYVLLGLAGLPVFTLGGGPGYLFQPSCGFLLGLIPAAGITGARPALPRIAPRRSVWMPGGPGAGLPGDGGLHQQ